MDGDACVRDFGIQARVPCGGAKGAWLIVITIVLWALLQSQRVEVGGVQSLIEDGVEGGIMVEVAYKHVSICCWDSGNL